MSETRPPEEPQRSSAIDRDEIHRLPDAVYDTVDRATPETPNAVLHARARALAKPPGTDVGSPDSLEVVEFLLADEHYGFESSAVREVYPLTALTPLPCTPPFVLGIINVRGQILSVIDLKVFFDLPHNGLTNFTRVLILSSGRMEFGILADVVSGIRQVLQHALQPSLPTLTDIRKEYLTGVTPDRLVVLNAEKLLSDPAIIVHEAVD